MKSTRAQKNEYMRVWREKNREKYKEYQRKYMDGYMTKERKETALKRSKEYYTNHKEEVLRRVNEYYHKNKRLKGRVKGDSHHQWKGDAVGYDAVHSWIKREMGKPSFCELCKTTSARRFEWANKDHKYRRKIEDYIRLCTSCHRKYDYDNHLSDKGSGGGSIKNKL